MCFKKPDNPISGFKETMFTVSEVTGLLKAQFPQLKLDMDDRKYWTVSSEDWGKIIRDVLLNMPKYISERYDCDNFSRTCACRVASKYFLNTMGVVEGEQDGARHKWNLFFSDDLDIFMLEPQNSMMYDMSDMGGYVPDELSMG